MIDDLILGRISTERAARRKRTSNGIKTLKRAQTAR